MATFPTDRSKDVLALVERAGAALMGFWPGGPAGKSGRVLKIHTKPDGSFVTEADFASNDILVPGLKQLFADHGVLSEEGPPDSELKNRSHVWILDPLDGTKSFIDGNDDFSVLVALCVHEVPEFSVMHVPARELTATAQRGAGAWMNGQRLQVSSSTQFRPRSIYLRHMDVPPAPYLYDRWLDSGLAFLTLCTGDFDGFILKIRTHREWDLAAPTLMVEESGGKVTDEHGAPIRFAENSMTYRYLVASNGVLHDELLALIPDQSA
jgi:myo-inositol-1(or 4)-monophosphatase